MAGYDGLYLGDFIFVVIKRESIVIGVQYKRSEENEKQYHENGVLR